MVGSSHSFWYNKRVLVTGHSGFKGSWLTIWLLKLGAYVWGYSLQPEPTQQLFIDLELRAKSGSFDGRLRSCHGDIRDYDKFSRFVTEANPDVVFHLAAQPLVLAGYQDPHATWSTNLMGSINLLQILSSLDKNCAAVIVTTDKVYANHEWDHSYRECDEIGGIDPYSASKSALEIAVNSWRQSFYAEQRNKSHYVALATARAGNVIGGGDWSNNRLVPDAIRALMDAKIINIRRPASRRPWQHVLEPLNGYLILAEKMWEQTGAAGESNSSSYNRYTSAYNFGPDIRSNKTVEELVEEIIKHWPGKWIQHSPPSGLNESGKLHLNSDKSYRHLGWKPTWTFETTVLHTVQWYKSVVNGMSPIDCCLTDLESFQTTS